MTTPKLSGRPMTKIRDRVRHDQQHQHQEHLKTAKMYRLEKLHGKPIQELLQLGSGYSIALLLKVSESCISRWRAKFGLPVDR